MCSIIVYLCHDIKMATKHWQSRYVGGHFVFCYIYRNRPELLTDKETGLENETQPDNHPSSMTDQSSTVRDGYGAQDTMVTPHQQQPQDIMDTAQSLTLSQNTSVGMVSSDEIEEFEDDDLW